MNRTVGELPRDKSVIKDNLLKPSTSKRVIKINSSGPVSNSD